MAILSTIGELILTRNREGMGIEKGITSIDLAAGRSGDHNSAKACVTRQPDKTGANSHLPSDCRRLIRDQARDLCGVWQIT